MLCPVFLATTLYAYFVRLIVTRRNSDKIYLCSVMSVMAICRQGRETHKTITRLLVFRPFVVLFSLHLLSGFLEAERNGQWTQNAGLTSSFSVHSKCLSPRTPATKREEESKSQNPLFSHTHTRTHTHTHTHTCIYVYNEFRNLLSFSLDIYTYILCFTEHLIPTSIFGE